MRLRLGVWRLGSESTDHYHHRNRQPVYGSFASHLGKCPIKMIQNQIKYLTFAFGASSGLATVPLDSESEMFDTTRLRFLSPNSPLLCSDGEPGRSNSVSLLSNWSSASSYWLGREGLHPVGESAHSISLASLSVPSSRHASPTGLDVSIRCVFSCWFELEFDVFAIAFQYGHVWYMVNLKYVPSERTHNCSNGVIG